MALIRTAHLKAIKPLTLSGANNSASTWASRDMPDAGDSLGFPIRTTFTTSG